MPEFVIKFLKENTMNIADNILNYHLRNVYFICGTACGGKTTVSTELAKKHGFMHLHMDDRYSENRMIADHINQPAMTAEFESWEHYFNRPYREYSKWLNDSMNEQLPMLLIELIKLSENQKVIADMIMPVKTALSVADAGHVAFLVADPETVTKDYYVRPDHQDIYRCIMSLSDPKKALENCSKTLEYGTQQFLDELYESGAYYLKRDENSTVGDTLKKVEKHFGLI